MSDCQQVASRVYGPGVVKDECWDLTKRSESIGLELGVV
jgi:hypothetical protein